MLVASISSALQTVRDSAGTFYFGLNVDRSGDVSTPYAVADIRLSSGQRYSTNFVPEVHFTNDAMTRALWHLDTGTGTRVVDS
jgi:hypothetical protein